MSFYAANVGLVVATPFVPHLNVGVTPKTLLVVPMILSVLLNMLCASLTDPDAILLLSFLIGLTKGALVQAMIGNMMVFFSLSGDKKVFFARFYPFMIGLSQLSMVITAHLAYTYYWQHIYYLIAILYLIAIIVVLVFFRYAPRPTFIRYGDMDFTGAFFLSVAWLSMLYLCCYGKTIDRFSSIPIRLAAILFPFALCLVVCRIGSARSPHIVLRPLRCRQCVIGYVFMVLASIFSVNGTLISTYTGSVLGVDYVYTNTLYFWTLVGLILGGLLSSCWSDLHRRISLVVSCGFGCYVGYLAIIYFGVAMNATHYALIPAMTLSGIGQALLYVVLALYVAEQIIPSDGISNPFYFISFRTVLAPGIASSFYANALYRMG